MWFTAAAFDGRGYGGVSMVDADFTLGVCMAFIVWLVGTLSYWRPARPKEEQ
jgi:hypothetical protein